MTAIISLHPSSQDSRALRAALDAQADRIRQLEAELLAAERDYADLSTATARLHHRLANRGWMIAAMCTNSALAGLAVGHWLWP